MPNASGVSHAARIRCASGWKCVDHNGQVGPEACESGFCSAQANLFLDRHEGSEATGQGMFMEATQEVEKQDAAGAVVDAFAGHASTCQVTQFGEDDNRVTYMHAKRLHLCRVVDSKIDI
jgi:hypothetical protein